MIPLPVEVCACGIGPQMPSPCAVWVHVGHLRPAQHGHVTGGAGLCSHSTCGRQSAKDAEEPLRWRRSHNVEDSLLEAFPGHRIVSVQYSVQEPLHEPLCTAALPPQPHLSLSPCFAQARKATSQQRQAAAHTDICLMNVTVFPASSSAFWQFRTGHLSRQLTCHALSWVLARNDPHLLLILSGLACSMQACCSDCPCKPFKVTG